MKGLLFGNIGLKAAAVLLAVILWLFVVSKGQTEMALSVPIEYMNIPPGLEIAKHAVKSANLVLRAHESISRNIRQENVRVMVDVGRAKEGEGTFSLKKEDVKVPYAATVTKIDPSTVKVIFEETIAKRVAIRPVIAGTPENGYYIKSVETDPRDMVIEGAKSEIRKVSQIKTDPIDIAGFTEDLKQDVGLDISDTNIRSKTDKVEVRIRIGRRPK
jgi:hypothetical protein